MKITGRLGEYLRKLTIDSKVQKAGGSWGEVNKKAGNYTSFNF